MSKLMTKNISDFITSIPLSKLMVDIYRKERRRGREESFIRHSLLHFTIASQCYLICVSKLLLPVSLNAK